MTQWGIWKRLLPFHCSPVIDPDDDERVHRVLLSSLFCKIWFYHGLSVCCMPIASTDTSVSVDHWGSRLTPMWLTPIPLRSIATCNHSVVCSLFAHHVFPSENCHLQAHGWSSYGGRLQPFHVWVLLPIRGSRPPSDLLTRTMRLAKSAGLCIE